MIRTRGLFVLAMLSVAWTSAAAQPHPDGPAPSNPNGGSAQSADDVGLESDRKPARRYVTVELTPLNFELRFYGGQVEVIPASHHAIQLAAYYFDWTTGVDSSQNHFRGARGEIGYRYYFGDGGPRGFFLGPSFDIGSFEGIPQNGPSVHFANLGGAFDFGYQAVLLDRLVLGLGFGLQYTAPTTSIPQQEIPASIIANAGLRPRLLLAIGAAF